MKKRIIIVTIFLSGIFTTTLNIANANSLNGGKEKAVIQTSAICETCQKKIESALKKLDGIKSADLNLDDKKLTVVFDSTLITLDQIRIAISNTGYDADGVKANPEAYENLPSCCKKGGHE